MLPSSDDGWVGWKRKGDKPIELKYQFKSLRNFSEINIFSSNRYDLDIKVRRMAMRKGKEGGFGYYVLFGY